jgi:hypothetical protein
VFIRTAVRGFLLILSESSVHSDCSSRFPSHPVRIRCSFGLQFGVSFSSCPNQVLTRTEVRGFLLILSETGVHSDCSSGFPSHPVRIKCSFGLQFGVSFSSCPNQVLIRTAVQSFLLILSESGAHSDWGSGFPPNPVRNRCSFGLQFGVSFSSCPNQVLIRTSVHLLHLFLSESLIQTQFQVIQQNLFETDAHPYTLFFSFLPNLI